MSDDTPNTGKPLTGRKVFAIFAGAFAIIIGVNVFMAYSAIGTFPGLEVANSYVASQSFDADRAAQEALGWEVSAGFDSDEAVTLTIMAPNGQPARVESLDGTLGRATQRSDDQLLSFVQNDRGVHVASITPLDAGKWELRFVATAINGVAFKQRIEMIIPEE
jgi:nitrogen fixation protein FixH